MMMRGFLVVPLLSKLAGADCSACCVPQGSPASSKSGAVVCDECNLVAMQTNCMLDKSDALCQIVPTLKKCTKAASPALKQKCALEVQQMIVGQGPDSGDLGILSDYYVCCQRGATAFKSYTNETCYDTMQQSGGVKDKVTSFYNKYWGCVSPGTQTTPKGNWTAACDNLADDAEELAAFTLQTHDKYLEPCLDTLSKIKAAQTGKCGKERLTPQKVLSMANDWTDTAWGGSAITAKAATRRCIEAKWSPGCAHSDTVSISV